jgi:hypothetical protein
MYFVNAWLWPKLSPTGVPPEACLAGHPLCLALTLHLVSIPQETQTEFHKFNTKISVQNIYIFQNIRNSHFKALFSKWNTQGNIRQGCLNRELTVCFLRPASAFVNYEYICYNI